MPDWKAEYLKSVESGCITLGELRETRAELEATNRQVEILSDALAESRREVAALKAVQEPAAWQERQARRMSHGVVTEWTNWYPCRHRTIDEAREEASDHIPYEWRPLYTTPPAQPAVPDAIVEAGESPDYRDGWNDCRQTMLKGMK